MKNTIFALILIFIGITSCDKEESFELTNMRINHYQQPINNYELFTGMSYYIQEGDDIGSSNWTSFQHEIRGFEFEFGYVYDLTVEKEELENELIDHPNVIYTLRKINSKSKIDIETTFDLVLSIKYTNGYQALLKKDEFSNYYLLNSNIKIDCGDLYEQLSEKIENEEGIQGTFKHIDSQTIQLLKLN
ncbi:DUF4377 domain-containing protein [Flammeovirga sp. SJP92]|uniref:DUF4377 domain-containing protein n=1 Tax=Flammeovirga sp. SJP92 TaxID=1775430 RepID=UPI0007879BF6|nr:DUF4377 domain-containing protein [Flammeovirga sp. SJP92]KXX70868.1 hypothetical protein AVL50_10875 [Flammeovirga sp. SJP92]